VKGDRLIRPEHGTGSDTEKEGIADLSGSAGDGDFDGVFHAIRLPKAIRGGKDVARIRNSGDKNRKKGERNSGLILITHKLKEIMAVTDSVSVMRRGEIVATLDTAQTSPENLAELMVGRRVLLRVKKGAAKPGRVVLDVRNLTVKDADGVTRLDNVSSDPEPHADVIPGSVEKLGMRRALTPKSDDRDLLVREERGVDVLDRQDPSITHPFSPSSSFRSSPRGRVRW
jgi:hypothetical protein